MSVNLKDALLRLPAIVGPGASTSAGSGLVGPGLGSAAGSALGSLAGPLGTLVGSGVGWLADNILSGIRTKQARNWEEDMYNQYNSPSALVRQYQEAGINPALMFGHPTPAAPTDTSAAAVAPIAEILGPVMQLALMDEQKRGLKITNDANEFELGLRREFGPARADAELRQIEQSISLALAQCGEVATRSALNSAQSDFVKAQKGILDLEKVEKEWRKNFVDKYKMSPELAGELVRSLTTLASAGLLSVSKVLEMFGKRKGTHTRSITEKQADGTTITDTFSGFPDM